MNVIIILPPLVQLNTMYPSGAYLSSFFKSQGCNVKLYDGTIKLFYSIFSKKGLTKLFNLTSQKALKMAAQAERSQDFNTATNLKRYITQSSAWIEWIDCITDILKDGNTKSSREQCHRFIFSPHAPKGMRMENYLANLNHDLTTDDARFLASMALADLADYITAVFDKEFSLIRYAEALTVNESSFSQIEKGINSPVMENFYKEVLEKEFNSKEELISADNKKTLICISTPFAGTFTAGLYTAKFFKNLLGNNAFISMGGGFVNTELRDVNDLLINKYIDAISYDRGYGSYKNLMETKLLDKDYNNSNALKDYPEGFYKIRLFTKNFIMEQNEKDNVYEPFEDKQTTQIVPDFGDIDFGLYPRMIDDINPMQRMWSDGTWIKAYLAHGCYWHQCSFCDTTLDYVHSYRITKIKNLFNGLYEQAVKKGITGIHFVDEALPPVSLSTFALYNTQKDNYFNYWGNIRFEKTFSRDLADFLSYAGLTGVSGGIEIATGTGLDSIHKGTDINSIVSACCAFKEAGILVHAYMIYGYWQQNEQDLINSMETLRQFYAAGLLDSSFWHKFVLTRHSRIYDEWQKGMHPELKPIESKEAGCFAKNGLHFAGESKTNKYSDGLNTALNSWMHGEGLNKSVNKWFNFSTIKPTISPDYIQKAIENYEERKIKEAKAPLDFNKMFYLGGNIFVTHDNSSLLWSYMQEEYTMNIPKEYKKAKEFCEAVMLLRPDKHNTKAIEELMEQEPLTQKLLYKMRTKGLIQLLWNITECR